MADETIRDVIETNAAGPARVSADGVDIQQHPLRDQIAADKHVAASTGLSKKSRGLRFTRLVPPGAD